MIHGLGYLDTKVTIPVKVVNGKLEYFYGGTLPELEDGVIGELVLPIFAVKDKKFIQTISREEIVDLLPKGTKLFVSMRIDDFATIDPELEKLLIDYQYVPIILLEDLKLRFKGTKKPELLFCKCAIPALGKIEANSLNQAYSLISEQFEKKRMSHTGNVFTKVFTQKEKENFKYEYQPLSKLRSQKEAEYEKKYLLKDNN